MDEVAELIRIAKKYQSDALYEQGLELFKTAWPDTLLHFDMRNDDARRIYGDPEGDDALADDEYEREPGYILHLLPDPGQYSCRL